MDIQPKLDDRLPDRVYAGIKLDAVRDNFRAMKAVLDDGVKMIAVVKTNGYGHGAVRIASLVEGYDYIWGFAVATAEEAYELRDAGIVKPILILGFTFPSDYARIIKEGIRPAVFKLSMARQLSEEALKLGMKAPVHLALDTGMGRIGLPVSLSGAEEAREIAALEGIKIEGLFSHFSKADEEDKSFTKEQFDRYLSFCDMLKERGVEVEIRHISNSAAIMQHDGFQLDAVRAGISIYGISPSDETDGSRVPLRPVMELKSHIAFLKELPEGSRVSYGGTFVCERPTKIATVPVGYGDGYPRLLSSRACVLIRGKRCPIAGRVCMDQFMVDVTGMDVKEFDEVTLMGRDGDEEITVEELSSLCGRFPYEFVCDIAPRVPRVYFDTEN